MMIASALPKAVEELGAIAGLVSCLIFLIFLVLYVMRALEIRRLRRSMPFLVDPPSGNGKLDEQ
jgi:hypothetical protein